MLYEPNTIKWAVGDLVIHDIDAKRIDMVMRVEKVFKNGMILSKYYFPRKERCSHCGQLYKKQDNKPYRNHFKYLHDPRKFKIEVD